MFIFGSMGVFVFLWWFLMSILVGVGAHKRGRIGFGWFCFAFLFSPVMGALICLLMPVLDRNEEVPVVTVTREQMNQTVGGVYIG